MKQLQEKLNSQGANLSTDGHFGPKTETALKRFQESQGLARAGVAEADTLRSLETAGDRALPGAASLPGVASSLEGALNAAGLRRIVPSLSASRANTLLPHLNRAMDEAGIRTPRQQAAFVAQLAHESGGFRYMEELASGRAYEGRRDLGNTQRGDGVRYKGRGPIQLTGRANYRAAGRALGLPLEENPEMVRQPAVGFRVAAWFWNTRGLNRLAENGDFRGVTKRINGGYNGLQDRKQYYRRALSVMT